MAPHMLLKIDTKLTTPTSKASMRVHVGTHDLASSRIRKVRDRVATYRSDDIRVIQLLMLSLLDKFLRVDCAYFLVADQKQKFADYEMCTYCKS